jgi:mono/diheme cytochrome c family protein
MNKMVLGGVLLLLLAIGALVVQMLSVGKHVDLMQIGNSITQDVETGRWYSSQQVAQGEPLYQANCAGCHGIDAAATPNWREADENGHYPPPPLNGTAHAWHHPLPLLIKTIKQGGVPLGGQMPPFEMLLTDTEIHAILAWIQSHWSDEIYQRWSGRSG